MNLKSKYSIDSIEFEFKTNKAALAFCRVHPEYSHIQPLVDGLWGVERTCYFSNSVWSAFDNANTNFINTSVMFSSSCKSTNVGDWITKAFNNCNLSYKNVVVAKAVASVTKDKYILDSKDISHPVLVTYAIAAASPFIVLYLLVMAAFDIAVAGGFGFIALSFILGTIFTVEFVIPMLNSYNSTPVVEPWMYKKFLEDHQNEKG
jgi:hypothetical protein